MLFKMIILVVLNSKVMKKGSLYILVGLFFTSSFGFSQEKFEKEYRVKANAVPQKARQFIEQCELKEQIKWYLEESQDGKTFEAKTIKRRRQLSIEFDDEGNILDVEQRMSLAQLNAEKKAKISHAITERFGRSKLRKVQAQWSGSASTLIAMIKKGTSPVSARYFEIVLKSKRDREHYEVLLSDTGEFLKVLKITTGSFDNLEY